MEKLQYIFHCEVNDLLTEYGYYHNKYSNIDVFDFWNNIKNDKNFQHYISGLDPEDILYSSYEFIHDNTWITDEAEILCPKLIKHYLETNKKMEDKFEWYVYFVFFMEVILIEYLDFYQYIYNGKRPDYVNELYDNYILKYLTTNYTNTNSKLTSCLLNMDLTKLVKPLKNYINVKQIISFKK